MLASGFLPLLTPAVLASSPLCGATVSASVTLTSDITCGGTGITVGASGIVVNCAGHAIKSTGWFGSGINVEKKSKVTIEGCTISGFANGITLGKTTNSKVMDVRTSNESNAGIELNASSGITVTGSADDGSGFGFDIEGSSHITLKNDNATGDYLGFIVNGTLNKLASDRVYAINFGGTGFSVEGNRNSFTGDFVNGTAGDGDTGFAVNGNGSVFSGNTVQWVDTGFSLLGVSGNFLTSNVVANGAFNGFDLENGERNTLQKDKAINFGTGFYLSEDMADVVKGSVSNSSAIGFWVDTAARDSLLTNVAINSSSAGFLINIGTGTRVSGNTATGNPGDGFEDYGGTGDLISSNKALHNKGTGFVLDFGTIRSRLTRNNATANSMSGFTTGFASGNTFSSNVATSNSINGFVATGSSNSYIGNVATSNQGAGFFNSNGNGNIFTSNTANQNSGPGFHTDWGTSNKLTRNTANGNGAFGYEDTTSGGLTSGTGNYYHGNKCSGNFQGGSNPVFLCLYRGVSAGPITHTMLEADRGQNLTFTLTAHPIGGVAPYSYQWYSGPECISAIPGATGSNFTTTVSANGTYSYRVNDTTPSSVCSRSVSTTFNPSLSASFNPKALVVPVNEYQYIFLYVSVSGGTYPYLFQWYSGLNCTSGNQIPGANWQYYYPRSASNSNYSVLVKDSSGGTPPDSTCANLLLRFTGEPTAVLVNPATHTVYVSETAANDVSVLNETSHALLATIPVGQAPFGLALDTSTSIIYVVNAMSNSVSVINATTDKVKATISLGSIYFPEFVAVDPTTHMAYVTSIYSTLSIVNGTSDTLVKTVVVGGGTGIAVDSSTHDLYVAGSYTDSLYVLRGSDGSVITTIPGFNDPIGVVFDPATHTVFVANYAGDSVSVVNSTTNTVTRTIPLPSSPAFLTFDSNTGLLYTSNGIAGTVSVVNVTEGAAVDTLQVGTPTPYYYQAMVYGISVDPGTGVLVVASPYQGIVTLFDCSTDTAIATVYL